MCGGVISPDGGVRMLLENVDFRSLSTAEMREALVLCLGRFPQRGPGELSSYAGLVGRELEHREPDLDWAKTSFAVGECYRNLIPHAAALRLPSGLLAADVISNRAKEMFEAARDVFVTHGCDVDAARCLQAMSECDERVCLSAQEGWVEGPYGAREAAYS